jgi:tetratricopeptide (TPR) repeat protein
MILRFAAACSLQAEAHVIVSINSNAASALIDAVLRSPNFKFPILRLYRLLLSDEGLEFKLPVSFKFVRSRSIDCIRMKLESNSRYRLMRCILPAIVVLAGITPFLQSQQPAQPASLHVVVRESADRPVADVVVYVQAQEGNETLTIRISAPGSCGFANLPPGVYTIRVEKPGYTAPPTSLSLAANEIKEIHLTLSPAKTPPSQPASLQPTSEFFDQPHFTISGVTDTTSVGGHGSDSVARTRESLAKDTVSLGKMPVSTTTPIPQPSSEAALREKAEREPASFTANLDLGKILMTDGKSREATPYLERAEQLSSNQSQHAQAELHHLLATAQEKLGHSLEAVREYQRAAELDPNEAYLFDWGSELLLHHAPEPALEVFTKGNRLFPQSARMLMGIGAAWFASGSFDQAVLRICQASDLNPADSAPYQFLAKMQSTQTLTSDELVERLRRFASLYPENAAANYDYAVGLWKQRKSPQDSALIAQIDSLLHTAIRLDPRFGAAYLQLGILHSEQKDFSHAIPDYQHALHSDPQPTDAHFTDLQMTDLQIEEAHYRLAQVYREIGENDKAKAELQLYNQTSKESAEQTERHRREIGQFVYTLRDQPPAPH